jgi:putative ABC transport system substrate-binding protein
LINVLLNPNNLSAADQLKDLQDAARVSGVPINVSNASTEQDIHSFFMTLSQSRARALLISADAFFNARHEQLVTLAAHYGIPAIYPQREAAVAGGLMSYGTSLVDGYRQVGIYAGRILKGEKPGDLPVVQPTRFELVINLKTAKALGLTVPPNVLAIADEVIE